MYPIHAMVHQDQTRDCSGVDCHQKQAYNLFGAVLLCTWTLMARSTPIELDFRFPRIAVRGELEL